MVPTTGGEWVRDHSSDLYRFRNGAGMVSDALSGLEAERPLLSSFMKNLGLELPPGVPDCVMKPLQGGENVTKPEEDEGGQQLALLQPQETSEGKDVICATELLPPFPEAVQLWHELLSAEAGSAAADIAMQDAETFIEERAMGEACSGAFCCDALKGDESLRTALLSCFLFTYRLARDVFWAVRRGKQWVVHPMTTEIEKAYTRWKSEGEDDVRVGTELVDFASMVVRTSEGRADWMRRVSEPMPLAAESSAEVGAVGLLTISPFANDTDDASICRFRQTVWWAAGAEGRPHCVVRTEQGPWELESQQQEPTDWVDAKGVSAAELESLWSGAEMPWAPDLETQRWLEGKPAGRKSRKQSLASPAREMPRGSRGSAHRLSVQGGIPTAPSTSDR
eukprot:Hpha_TRINITY_DN22313_c0_g1::TRINITY_DN22313_c0_g1_i1::g.177643::m.177643